MLVSLFTKAIKNAGMAPNDRSDIGNQIGDTREDGQKYRVGEPNHCTVRPNDKADDGRFHEPRPNKSAHLLVDLIDQVES